MKMNARQAGSLGGRSTFQKHGRGYMAEIGRRGGQATHERYHLAPVNLTDFAMVRRDTGEIVAYLSGEKWERPSWER